MVRFLSNSRNYSIKLSTGTKKFSNGELTVTDAEAEEMREGKYFGTMYIEMPKNGGKGDGNSLVCPVCDKPYKDPDAFAKHIETKHPDYKP
jgi:hypothetical protein